MPLLGEAIDAIAQVAGPATEVRRILDLGSGPGVATGCLAERFGFAAVTAVDGSQPLLDLASARATRLGLGRRVDTRVADLEQPLTDIAPAGSVDVVWASMVLHHVVELPRVLADAHRLLRPGGVLAVVERHGPYGTLPSDFDVGCAGFADRLTDAVRASMQERLPPGAMSLDWPALLTEAGFELLEERTLSMHQPGPLDQAARTLVTQEIRSSAQMAAAHLDDADSELLSALVNVVDPRCILDRDDLPLAISRVLLLARRP